MAVALEARVGDRLTTTEASGLLSWHLAHGDAVTNEQAAQLTGLDPHSAYQMLCRLSRVIPIYEDADHAWQVLAVGEMD